MIMTFRAVFRALNATLQWSYAKIRTLVRRLITCLWALEIFKIGYRFYYGYGDQLNTWVPLYYCSITLFAGLLNGCGSGILQHIGDVFISVGGLTGGICFLLYPTTSLCSFPAFHLMSVHSFLYHGCMTYPGILLNRSGLVRLSRDDFRCYAFYVCFFCLIALLLNKRTGSNLMFISEPLEGAMYAAVCRVLGSFYTLAMILIQMMVPYAVIMWFKDKTALLNRPAWYDHRYASASVHKHA